MTARYVVIENTPGYLPGDDDPAVFEDHKSACEYLRERVESFCEFLAEGYDFRPGYELLSVFGSSRVRAGKGGA